MSEKKVDVKDSSKNYKLRNLSNAQKIAKALRESSITNESKGRCAAKVREIIQRLVGADIVGLGVNGKDMWLSPFIRRCYVEAGSEITPDNAPLGSIAVFEEPHPGHKYGHAQIKIPPTEFTDTLGNACTSEWACDFYQKGFLPA